MRQSAALRVIPQDLPAEAPRVYSYTRFSTPEQAQGDSFRRQADAAARWVSRKNAEREADGLAPVALDETLNLKDLGVSAFRGANTAEDSGLGGFVFACREGLIAPGSYLLVESLDRISRMPPRRVSRLLDDIVEAGVTVVTLSDGLEYDAQRLDSDASALLIALMVSWRAHEESKVKGQRVAAAWAEKRLRVRDGRDTKLTSRGPGWLHWTGEHWQERQPHAETVRRVYRWTLEGLGEHKIAERLNAAKVPTMGRSSMWHRSTIAKLLRNPAVIGTLTPGRMDYGTGKRERCLEEGIEGAYPAVIDRGDWLAVRAIKDGRTPAVKGRGAKAPLSNLFAGLARCPDCGAAMTRVYKGSGSKGGKPKLVCTRAKAGAAPHPYRSVPLDLLQEAFERDWQAILADIPAGEAGGGLDAEHANLSAVIAETESEVERLVGLCQRHPSQSVASRVRALEAQLTSLRADLSRLEDQRAIADHGLVVARVGALQDAMGLGEEPRPLDISRVNAALRAIFEGVTVDHLAGVLALRWRQGGESTIRFAWPDRLAR
ncbi:recombinase family protein [Novosphingobium aquiterrae]|uniref:Recombinase family protein n=1 Tax=Novosphingobium aquiterrae TaxID=624388 RepID=A0ABV6PKA4_9SPHN